MTQIKDFVGCEEVISKDNKWVTTEKCEECKADKDNVLVKRCKAVRCPYSYLPDANGGYEWA